MDSFALAFLCPTKHRSNKNHRYKKLRRCLCSTLSSNVALTQLYGQVSRYVLYYKAYLLLHLILFLGGGGVT